MNREQCKNKLKNNLIKKDSVQFKPEPNIHIYLKVLNHFIHHLGASLYHLKTKSKQKLGSSKSDKNQQYLTKLKGHLNFTKNVCDKLKNIFSTNLL